MEKHMRICLIAFAFSPYVGGSEVQAEKQARYLKSLNHEVTVLTMRHWKQWRKKEVLDGLPVVRVGGLYRHNGQLRIGRSGHPFIELMMLLMLWRMRRQYDVVHVVQMSSLAAVATLICQIMRKPIIISIQSAGPDAKQQARYKREGLALMGDTLAERDFLKVESKDWTPGNIEEISSSLPGGQIILDWMRRSEAYYQVLSTRCYAYLTAHGFKSERIIHIPNGVDIERFRPATTRPDSAQLERDIICVARLEYPKGVDVLLHAWSRMMQAPAEWRAHLKPRLRVVGHGAFRSQMERIVAELGIQESVEFLGLRRDIGDLLPQAWGFVMPSRWEGMPNALLEAMACGLPCVATRVSGSEDIIIDGVNGWLVEPEQPVEMALALQRLIEESTQAQCVGQKARATILRDYQIATVVERCLNLYRHLCSQDMPARPLAQEETRKL